MGHDERGDASEAVLRAIAEVVPAGQDVGERVEKTTEGEARFLEGVAYLRQGDSYRVAARKAGIAHHESLFRWVKRTGTFLPEQREIIRAEALQATEAAVRRMARDMDGADEKVVAQWARASASIAGMGDGDAGGVAAGAGDVVRKLAELLGEGGEVTAAVRVRRDTPKDAPGGS